MQFRLPKLQIRDPLVSSKILTYNKQFDRQFHQSISFDLQQSTTLPVTRSVSPPKPSPRKFIKMSIQERKLVQQGESERVKIFKKQLNTLLQSCISTSVEQSLDSTSIQAQVVSAPNIEMTQPQPSPSTSPLSIAKKDSSRTGVESSRDVILIKKVTINDTRSRLESPMTNPYDVKSPEPSGFKQFHQKRNLFLRKQSDGAALIPQPIVNNRYRHLSTFDPVNMKSRNNQIRFSPPSNTLVNQSLGEVESMKMITQQLSETIDEEQSVQNTKEITHQPEPSSINEIYEGETLKSIVGVEEEAESQTIVSEEIQPLNEYEGEGEDAEEDVGDPTILESFVDIDVQLKDSPTKEEIAETQQNTVTQQEESSLQSPTRTHNTKLTLHDQFRLTSYLKQQYDVKAKFFQDGNNKFQSATSIEVSSADRARTFKSRTTSPDKGEDQLEQNRQNSTRVDFTLSEQNAMMQHQKWKANNQLYHSFARRLRSRIHSEKINLRNVPKRDKNTFLIHHMFQNYATYIKYFHLREVGKLVDLYSETMGICQVIDNSSTFVQLTIILGHFFFDIHDYNKATFFLRQNLICCHLLSSYQQAIQTLLLLSLISIRLRQYSHSIQLLKRALEYSWYIDNSDLELKIYDTLGMSYFYCGQLNQAEIFHQKFMTGTLEPPKSRIRLNAISMINYNNSQDVDRFRSLEPSFMIRTSLPIVNMKETVVVQGEDGPVETHLRCDRFKTITYLNCNARKTLSLIVEQDKFNLTELDINGLEIPFDFYETPYYAQMVNMGQKMRTKMVKSEEPRPTTQHYQRKDPNKFGYIGVLHAHLPQNILAIKQRHIKMFRRHQEIDFYNGVYKMGTDKLIKNRLAKLPQVEQVFSQIQSDVNSRNIYNHESEEKREQIFIKHLNNPQNYNLEEKVYLQKYRGFLDKLIIDLY